MARPFSLRLTPRKCISERRRRSQYDRGTPAEAEESRWEEFNAYHFPTRDVLPQVNMRPGNMHPLCAAQLTFGL